MRRRNTPTHDAAAQPAGIVRPQFWCKILGFCTAQKLAGGQHKQSLWSFMALSASGECPCQSVTSPATRRGSRERYDFVGLHGYFLSVRLGSSIIGPVGSIM